MPPPYGLTAAGFNAPTFDEAVALVKSDMRARNGSNFAVDAAPVADEINSRAVGEVAAWQAIEVVWLNSFPDTSGGVSLDMQASAEGIIRDPDSFTLVNVTLTGTPGTVIGAGKIVSSPTSGTQWALASPATIGGGGTVSAVFACTVAGEIPALAGTLTHIVTPVAGWASATNPTDHTTLGALADEDDALRAKLFTAVGGPAQDGADDIHRAVSAVSGVTRLRVFENDDDTPDDAGRPGHAFEVVVLGGADADIATAIWSQSKAAGIKNYGSSSASVTDAEGNAQVTRFSRPGDYDVYATFVVHRGGVGVFPPDGAAQLTVAAVEHGDALGIGASVIARNLDRAIGLPGIDHIDIYLGRSASPADTADLVSAPTERPVLDSTRIVVTVI